MVLVAMLRQVRKVLTAFVVTAFLAVVLPGIASAHANLVSSNPAAGTTLDRGPARASLTFDEPLATYFATVTLVGPDGNVWSHGLPEIDGTVASVAVGDLGPVGTYTIGYRLVASDGHPATGSVSFTLRTAGHGTPGKPAAAQSSSQDPQSGSSTGVIVVLVGLVVVMGCVFPLYLLLQNRRRKGDDS